MKGDTLRAPEMVVKVDKAPVVSQPSEKQPSEAPAAAPTVQTSVANPSYLRRSSSISIKTASSAPKENLPLNNNTEAKPLTFEHLKQCWTEMLEAMREPLPKVAENLATREIRFVDEDNFTIVVSNSYVESEIKPHILRILTYLRTKTQRPMLNCRIEVEYEEQESVAYIPRDKYDLMVSSNKALETFKIIFPEVDY